MGRRAPILGILGLVFIGFALIEHWMTYDPRDGLLSFGWYAMLHLGAGVTALIWYFWSGSGSIGSFVKARSTRYGFNAAVYSTLFVAVIAMLNFLGTRYHHRFDLSSAGVNSLSEQSKQVLRRLDKDVEILAFVGPQDKDFLQDVIDIYGYASDRVHFRMVDPQVNPELAQREMITHIPTLKVKMGDRSTVVRKIDEESITNGINTVSTETQKKIYFVEGHGEPSIDDSKEPGGMGMLAADLREQNYDVGTLFLAEAGKVPDDAAVVVAVATERSYFPAELDVLRDYMKGGGHVLWLLEPRRGEELSEVLNYFGIYPGNDVILDQQMRLFEGLTLGLDPVVSNYGKHPSVEPIKDRTFFSLARSISLASDPIKGLTLTPLAFTGKTSWAETDIDRVFDKGEAELDDKDKPGPVPLAAAGSAPVSAFGGQGADELRFVVFGDSSFATNQYIRQLFNDSLALSVIGWLAGENQFISINPRTIRASRAYLSPEQARTVFYLSVLALPELILLAGIAVWWRRSAL